VLQIPDERSLQAISDPELILRARERLKQKWSASESGNPKLKVPRLRGDFSSEYQSQDKLLNLHYRTGDSRPALDELNALIEQFLEDRQTNQMERRQAELQQERQILNNEDARLIADLEQCRQSSEGLQNERQQYSARDASHATSLEQIRTLSKALAFARLSRAETEQHIRIVEEYLNGKKSVGMMVAKLPEGRVREFLQGILEQQQLRTELEQNRQMQTELAGVYGRNHPRIKELSGKIELLAMRQSTGTLPASFNSRTDLGESSLILQSIRNFVQQSLAYEEEVQLQLERAQSAVDAEHRVDTDLADLSKRIEQGEARRMEIRNRLVELESQPMPNPIVVAQPPWLMSEPVSVRLETVLLFSVGPGFLLGLLLQALWSNRPSRRVQRLRGTSPSLPSLQERRRLRQSRMRHVQG
jgi:hypothetical protein